MYRHYIKQVFKIFLQHQTILIISDLTLLGTNMNYLKHRRHKDITAILFSD